MGNKLATIKNTVTMTVCRTGLKLKKNSPELLMIGGLIGFGVTVALVIRESFRAKEEVIDPVGETIDTMGYAVSDPAMEDYTEDDLKRDRMVEYRRAAVELAKIYWPAAAVGVTSITCIICSNRILKNRYLGAVATATAVTEAFNQYRKRVRETLGEEVDNNFLYGTHQEIQLVPTKGENGKLKNERVEETVLDPDSVDTANPYVKIFDCTNPNWDRNMQFNMSFLQAQNERMMHILNARGHLFLNEVFDMLGFERTPAGAVTGWTKKLNDDGYVDIGLFDQNTTKVKEILGGKHDAILLNFNVDGVIWDKI